MVSVFLGVFGVFMLALIILDIGMIISLLRQGDERRQLIVLKASAFTLLVTVGGLIVDVAETVIKAEPMQINPFIKLSVIAMTYFVTLLFFRKRYGG